MSTPLYEVFCGEEAGHILEISDNMALVEWGTRLEEIPLSISRSDAVVVKTEWGESFPLSALYDSNQEDAFLSEALGDLDVEGGDSLIEASVKRDPFLHKSVLGPGPLKKSNRKRGSDRWKCKCSNYTCVCKKGDKTKTIKIKKGYKKKYNKLFKRWKPVARPGGVPFKSRKHAQWKSASGRERRNKIKDIVGKYHSGAYDGGEDEVEKAGRAGERKVKATGSGFARAIGKIKGLFGGPKKDVGGSSGDSRRDAKGTKDRGSKRLPKEPLSPAKAVKKGRQKRWKSMLKGIKTSIGKWFGGKG